MVPHLTTALTGPLLALERRFLDATPDIERAQDGLQRVRKEGLRAAGQGALVRAAGIVVGRQRPGTATGIVFVTLEDETGLANIVVHPQLVEKQRRELLAASLLGVYGQLQKEGAVVHLVARRLVDLSAWLGRLETSSRDFH